MKWELISADSESISNWNNLLKEQEEFSMFQTAQWTIHKSHLGWSPLLYVCRDSNNKVVSMASVLFKKKFSGVVAAWIAGGPTGNAKHWGADLRDLIKKETGAKLLYIRVLNNQIFQKEQATELQSLGWNEPSYKIRSGLSMVLSLETTQEELRLKLSKNWKKNLKRSEKKSLNISYCENPDVEQIFQVFEAMQKIKGLDEQFSKEELESIFKHMPDQIHLFTCQDEEGNLIALRGCVVFGICGWDLFAAANEQARNNSATYALLWRLLQHCRTIGITHYDLLGIDPTNNPGVYSFKRGTGAEEIKYLGEWEWANIGFMKIIINFAIKRGLI